MGIFDKLFGKQNSTTLKKIYYDNGNIKEEIEENKKGERHGITKLYHENGQLQVEVNYTNGLQDDGKIISYHDNGIKARQVIRLRSEFNGEYFEWHKNGQKKLDGTYKNGNPTIIKQWSKDGLLIEKERKPSKKEVVEQYKINDDMSAIMDTAIEGHKMFKRDMTGLMAYFEEMPDMGRIYNEFTNLIRDGLTVEEYLNGTNFMDDIEVRSVVEKGFEDIAAFLRDMLEIQENSELRKDFNACIEATKILKEKSSKSKKEATKLTDEQKHWLSFLEMRINAISFESIKSTFTIDSFAHLQFDEYKKIDEVDEVDFGKDIIHKIAQSRVEGFLSIGDYIKTSGSEEQKFHYESSLKGALLYATSLGINFDLTEIEEFVISEENEDKFKGYYQFNKIINKMKEILGNEVFDTIGKYAGFKLNNDRKINSSTYPSQEQLLDNFFEIYESSYVLCLAIAEIEKLNNSFVIDQLIFNLYKPDSKISEWINNLTGPSAIAANVLINNYSLRKNNFAYEEGFELGDFDFGLIASSESIFYQFLENAKELDDINDNFKIGVSGLLDTFGYGLYLKNEFEPSITLYNKSIELSPYHPKIAEHLTNRGKSKLKLNDKEGAILDFQRALEKDENFEEARALLDSMGK
jgi:antitoxin component YwqK of YwqJK toxin-antitoxin module